MARKWNVDLKFYEMLSTDDTTGVTQGQKAYFSDLEKWVIWDGSAWVDEKIAVNAMLADGYDITLGAKADAPIAVAATTAPNSLISLAKGIWNRLFGVLDVQVSGSKAQEYEALTIDNTAGGIACTTAKVGTCTKAFMTLETAQIRYTVDGTAPTVAVGHLLNVGETLKLDSAEDIAAFRGFRTGAVSGSLRCTYSV
jgi:hypothetical protein